MIGTAGLLKTCVLRLKDVPLDVDALLVNVDVFPEKRLREIVDEPVMGVVLLDRLGTVLTSGLAVHEVDDRVPE